MKKEICNVKRKLDESISQLCEDSWMFSVQPQKDFSRARKLPLRKVISILLSMQGGTLTTELLKHFHCSKDTVSASAFVQQRSKINSNAFPYLFNLFVKKTDAVKLYKGYRLFAADGSDVQIPNNPFHKASFYPKTDRRTSFNLLHLDVIYDLLRHTYQDANLVGDREANESKALCNMVDRSSAENVLLIADRGYENYNLMAHIQEKGWKFLIRIKDVSKANGIARGLDLPSSEEFDLFIDLSLTTKLTKDIKLLCENKNQYRRISSKAHFDYLPKMSRKNIPAVFYKLPFRIVRFKIADNSYETVVTNLDEDNFPPAELKKLYAMRWGIENSFRELKYTVGLFHFHSKKVEHIYQEVFARLIMYNFTELITSPVIIRKADCKYVYKANFSVAVHLCRQFFLGNISPPDVEALICRYISPVRPDRNIPRNHIVKQHSVSFTYRIA